VVEAGQRPAQVVAPTGSGKTSVIDIHLKLGARYYNPTTARFTQPDPSGKEANTYIYAGDNPTNGIDPTGYGFLNDLAGAFSGMAAGADCMIVSAGSLAPLCAVIAFVVPFVVPYSLNYIETGAGVSW